MVDILDALLAGILFLQENNGYRLMTRLGWCKGRGLGKEEQGISSTHVAC